MRRSSSSPSLSALGARAPCVAAPAARLVNKSLSCQAGLHALGAPTNAIEYVGFTSMLHLSHAAAAECSMSYMTVDFPGHMLAGSSPDDVGLALCLQTPQEDPTQSSATTHAASRLRPWMTGETEIVERFHLLLRRRRLK